MMTSPSRSVRSGPAPVDRAPGPSVRVLIQDPHLLVRSCLRIVVEQLDGARVVAEADSPADALDQARLINPDIVMLDLTQTDSAIPVIQGIVGEMPDARVICLADDPTEQMLEAAIRAGATGVALKSESVEDLMRAFDLVRNGRPTVAPNAAGPFLSHYIKVIREKQQRDAAIIETLASAVDAKDRYTSGHTQRVTKLAVKLAEHLDPALGANEQLRYGFILHDVGKIGVPDHILFKNSGLTRAEWTVMRTHPIIGLTIISPVGLGADVESVVRNHHERWDGGGYPDGLAGEEISVGARLFAVADAFDALTSERPYRRSVSSADALREIESASGSQFDPDAVKALMDLSASGDL